MPRRTIRAAVEQICSNLEKPIHLGDLVRRVVEALGIEERPSTAVSVREALGRLPFMVRAGEGLYAPARVVLDGKAFRLEPPPGGWDGLLPFWRLEPFISVLENPRVVAADGRPLPTGFDRSGAEAFARQVGDQARRRAAEFTDSFLAEIGQSHSETGPSHARSPGGTKLLLDRPMGEVAEERASLFVNAIQRLAPYRLPGTWDKGADLIVRYDARSHTLTVTPESQAERDEERISSEGRRLCDFVASHLRAGSSLQLHDLVLQAYAQLPRFGEYPGPPPHVAVGADPRLRLSDPDFTVGIGKLATNPAIAKADDLIPVGWVEGKRTTAETGRKNDAARRQRRSELRRTLRARIRTHLQGLAADLEEAERQLGLGESWRQADTGTYAATGGEMEAAPTGSMSAGMEAAATEAAGGDRPAGEAVNEALLDRWELHLKQQGLSERTLTRKLNHLEGLAEYLASGHDLPPTTLLGAGGGDLQSFFFWAYVRRYPSSPTDAQTFTLDVRDFYGWLEQEGLLRDSRFAELPYRLRHRVAERIRLYMALDPDDPGWEGLYEELFLKGPL